MVMFPTRTRLACLFLVQLVFFQPVAAAATEDVYAWLEKMSRGVQMLNYDGIFVYLHGRQLESMRIVHMVTDVGERERLVSLNGAAREILRDNDTVTCIMPDSQAVWVDRRSPQKTFPMLVPDALPQLKQHYDFRLGGKTRVADRPAQLVQITPRDKYRYGYYLWLDADTALPLKSDLLDEEGKAIEQIMFTSLRYPDEINLADLEPSTRGEAFTWKTGQKDSVPRRMTHLQWEAGKVPPGFTLQTHERRPLPESHDEVEHMMYSDGLASFSVYIEKSNGGGLDGHSRMGAVNAFGKKIDAYQVTVVGEVPKAAVMLIGSAVKPSRLARN